MAQQPASLVLSFYAGGIDHCQRTLVQILQQDDRWLEQRHDFIQWLFPLPEPSPYNPDAPLLRASDIAAFQADPQLRGLLLDAFRRMLDFYGFECTVDPGRSWLLTPGGRLAPGEAHWIAPHDHNLLRISRILRCLHLLGCPAEAAAFLAALERLGRTAAGRMIGATTFAYWRAAAAGIRLA